jgi:hypothetical protein
MRKAATVAAGPHRPLLRHSALAFGHRFCPETSLGRTALAISTLATLAKPARSTTLICMPSGDNGDRRFAPLSPVRLRRITGKSFVLPFVPRVGSKVVTMVIRGRVNTYGSSLPTYLAPRFSAHARITIVTTHGAERAATTVGRPNGPHLNSPSLEVPHGPRR